MKVLVIQSTSLGKLVMSTPVVRLLKTQLEAEVHYVTADHFRDVFVRNPYVDEAYSMDANHKEDLKRLKKIAFDMILDLENSLKSYRFRRRMKGKKVAYRNPHWKTWWSLKLGLEVKPVKHLTEQYIAMLAPWGLKSDSLGLDYFIPDKDKVEWDWLPETHRNGYAVFILDASKKTRQLPLNRMIELCDRINKPIVLLGEKEEDEIASEIETFFRPGNEQEEKAIESLNKKASIFNACGKFNLNQTASIIELSSWVFTHDNDFMHVAAALNKQIFSIWGSSTAHFGEYPYRTKFTIFENNKINCRPCSLGGYNHCPKGHFKCMNDLTFDFYLPD